jgi:hypothetical protein
MKQLTISMKTGLLYMCAAIFFFNGCLQNHYEPLTTKDSSFSHRLNTLFDEIESSDIFKKSGLINYPNSKGDKIIHSNVNDHHEKNERLNFEKKSKNIVVKDVLVSSLDNAIAVKKIRETYLKEHPNTRLPSAQLMAKLAKVSHKMGRFLDGPSKFIRSCHGSADPKER